MALSGLQLPGTFEPALLSLAQTGKSLEQTVNFEVIDAARDSADGSASVSFYIMSDYDINSHVEYHNSSEDGEDDSFSMTAITLASKDAVNEKLKLPDNSGVSVKAGHISVADPNADDDSGAVAAHAGFPVTLIVSCNDQGLMSVDSLTIGGNAVTGEQNENPGLAQQAYWDINAAPSPDKNSADILQAALTSGDLTTNYSAELAAIRALYNNKSMIESWTIKFSAVAKAPNNTLAAHARHLGRDGSTVFQAGDKLITSGSYGYAVAIVDFEDSATTIVAEQNVFGVLQQTA
ncbi:MAG: hypothetical protein CMD35_01375 [Flavobacteriales bacterium]|nr:hypothetical protein [Flavobacteriales bacterium]